MPQYVGGETRDGQEAEPLDVLVIAPHPDDDSQSPLFSSLEHTKPASVLLREPTRRTILCAAQDVSVCEGVPALKTCPACHRSVPDDAATCPHPNCGHRFGASHTSIKRPPPPPTRIQVTGANSRGASSPTAAKQLSTVEPKPWRWPLVLLTSILLTSGLTAALTAFWLRGDQKQQVVAAKDIAPQAESKADSKSAEPAARQPPKKPAAATVDESSKPPQPLAEVAEKDGTAEHDVAAKRDGAVVPPKADAPPKKPG